VCERLAAELGAATMMLATGKPIGSPLTGHTDAVGAVATAQLDGRTVMISGSRDHTVRVRDLAARTHPCAITTNPRPNLAINPLYHQVCRGSGSDRRAG
jgi:WD40 repeat protein